MIKLNNFLRKEREGGFTLIELIVVIVIIGILAAIALPIFSGHMKAASAATVKSDVRSTVDEVGELLTRNPTAPSMSGVHNVLSHDNILILRGAFNTYTIEGTAPSYPEFRWCYNSVTGHFGEFDCSVGTTETPNNQSPPTVDPNSDPNGDPVIDPNSDPTANPVGDPVVIPNPTGDPTGDPTTEPPVVIIGDPTFTTGYNDGYPVGAEDKISGAAGFINAPTDRGEEYASGYTDGYVDGYLNTVVPPATDLPPASDLWRLRTEMDTSANTGTDIKLILEPIDKSLNWNGAECAAAMDRDFGFGFKGGWDFYIEGVPRSNTIGGKIIKNGQGCSISWYNEMNILPMKTVYIDGNFYKQLMPPTGVVYNVYMINKNSGFTGKGEMIW